MGALWLGEVILKSPWGRYSSPNLEKATGYKLTYILTKLKTGAYIRGKSPFHLPTYT